MRPSAPSATALDPVPNGSFASGLQSIVSTTLSVAVSMTLTVSLFAFATYTNFPFALAVMPLGCPPTVIVFVCFHSPPTFSTTDTLP